MRLGIQPENTFIDTNGHVVLSDFGIASLFGDCPRIYISRAAVLAHWHTRLQKSFFWRRLRLSSQSLGFRRYPVRNDTCIIITVISMMELVEDSGCLTVLLF
jgi:serine/threonine protein kinase